MSGLPTLSLFSLLDHYPEQPLTVGDRLRESVRRAETAEALGYRGLWFAEHHFRPFGALPNPAVLLAAIAARTRRIRLGPAVSVLPLRHPLQVAEDYLMVDQLSGGRLDLGVGSGTLPWEFEGFGVRHESKAEHFDEALTALRPVLRGRATSLSGRHVQVRDVGCNVPPHGPTGPPIYVATNRTDNAERAGREGDRLLTLVSPETPTLDAIDERLAAYRDGRSAAGQPDAGAHVVVAIQAHVAATDARAQDGARAALARFLAAHGGLEESRANGVFEAMLNRGTGLFGSAATVAAGLAGLASRGVRHVALWIGFGGMATTEIDAALRLLAAEALAPVAASDPV